MREDVPGYFKAGGTAPKGTQSRRNKTQKNNKTTTVKEILEYEDSNENTIRIHLEGMFAKAYEKSAYLLSILKPLKATVRFVKSENREVISVGMPIETSHELLKNLPCQNNGTTLVYTVETTVDETEYANWREAAANAAPRSRPMKKGSDAETDPIRKAIRSLDISKSTPIDCMSFIVKLKEMMEKE